jgi:hypothetical protein
MTTDITKFQNISIKLTELCVQSTFNDLQNYLKEIRFIAKTQDLQDFFITTNYDVTFDDLCKYLKKVEFPIKLASLKNSLGYFGYCEEIFVFDESSKIKEHTYKYIIENESGKPEFTETKHQSDYILNYDFVHYLTTLGAHPIDEKEAFEMIREYSMLPDCKGIPIELNKYKHKYKYYIENHGVTGYGIHIDQLSRLILSK